MKQQLKDAVNYIENCLIDYCENNIESDKEYQKKLDKAWLIIKRNINHE